MINKEQIRLLAENMNDGKWYTHFWDVEGNITVVFSGGKIFNFNYHNKETWKDAVSYGLQMGVPLEQLDFLID